MNYRILASVLKNSPRFVEICNQAEKAELLGLNEICGMGYRKALEVLIKDFFINYKKQPEVASLWLDKAIKKIEDPDIERIANACKELGNDAAHYEVKYDHQPVGRVLPKGLQQLFLL